jgi:hypothetical protein
MLQDAYSSWSMHGHARDPRVSHKGTIVGFVTMRDLFHDQKLQTESGHDNQTASISLNKVNVVSPRSDSLSGKRTDNNV